MEKHHKHSEKNSLIEALRVHDDWVRSPEKISIGHCGKYLDF